jgi:hypothetical protein
MSDEKGFDYGRLLMAVIILIVAYFAFAISDAFAAGENYADLTWVAPTDSLTGDRDPVTGKCITEPIPATGPSALAGFRIVYNTSVEALNLPPPDTDCGKTKYPDPTGTVINITDPAARSYRVQPLTNGTYYFMIAAINQAGAISYFTGPGSKTINVTTTFSTIAAPVYRAVMKTNGYTLVQVGTVPLNTPCDRTQTVNGHYVVPISAVAWSGTVRPIVVVAQCTDH